jgi:lipopolysaccharide biosynthesis glycosyltransferase
MNIIYSASDLYSSLAGISLVSLLENNKDTDEIHVFMLDNGISDENKKKLTDVVEKYNRDIAFYSLPKNLLGKEINVQKWNISTFGRLFEASILPQWVDKIIHVDCDTVVVGSLKELWDLDMSRAIVAGAVDCLSDEYKRNIGLEPTDSYLNAGCIVLNLERIRKTGIEKKFQTYIDKNCHMLTYVDQEVLNACVPEDEKIVVPLKYNSYGILHYLTYHQLKQLRHLNHMFTIEEYEEAIQNPIVIHYTSCFLEGTRPWIVGDNHPKRSEFIKYKKISPWADMPLWEDRRGIKAKITASAVRIIPKCILAPVVGYVHGVYVPKKNKRQQEMG